MMRQAARITSRIAAICLFGAVVFSVAVIVIVPRLTHGTSMTVLTGSMTPTIPVGSLVVDAPVDPGTLKVGDIATYQAVPGKPDFITHRIVGINTKTTPTLFTFKGDANRGPDMNPVPATAIRGRVLFHVRYLGAVRDLVHTKGGLAGIAMVVLAGYALLQVSAWLRDRSAGNSRRSEGTASDEPAGRDEVTVVAVVRDDALVRLSHQQARTLLRSRVLDRKADSYAIAVDVDAADVGEAMRTLGELGAADIELRESDMSRDRPAARLEQLDQLRHGQRGTQVAPAGTNA